MIGAMTPSMPPRIEAARRLQDEDRQNRRELIFWMLFGIFTGYLAAMAGHIIILNSGANPW